MRQKRVRLDTLDTFIHYSLAIYFGLPILIFAVYFMLVKLDVLGNKPDIDILSVIIPALMLGPIAFIIYIIQYQKLKFQFIRTTLDVEASKKLIQDIVIEFKWTVRSFKNNEYTIKTNPGFVNQSWGQHVTIRLVKGGLLVNSIFDTNKGSWLITFGSNQKNIKEIKRAIKVRVVNQN
jgi:hypothetical protein